VLVIETAIPLPSEVADGASTVIRHTLALASPDSLRIDTWRAGVAGAAPTTVTTWFTRTAETR
jgi:hypothetical protein